MKKLALLTILLFCFATIAKAQDEQPDYCKQISRDTDATAGKRTYLSPEGNIIVKSECTAAGQTITINFNVTDIPLSEETGLFTSDKHRTDHE